MYPPVTFYLSVSKHLVSCNATKRKTALYEAHHWARY